MTVNKTDLIVHPYGYFVFPLVSVSFSYILAGS